MEPIPLIGDSFLDWRQKYPAAADELIARLNALTDMSVTLVVPAGGTALGQKTTALVFDGNRFRMELPLLSKTPIASPTGGATVDTQARAAIDQIRAYLIAAGLTPP